MKIRISFYDSADYTFDNIENYIRVNKETGKDYFTVNGIQGIIGQELAEILKEDYFNGADNAVNYLGYSLPNKYFEFELIPNI